MEKHHNRKHNHWNNHNNKNNSGNASRFQEEPKASEPKFRYIAHDNLEAQQKKEAAIQEIKGREVICPKCGEAITDLASAMQDKATGKPMHFECVMNELGETEKVGQNEKICYIGQGRFGILYFENPRDQRKFTIKKIIEWEERDKKGEWRNELSSLYSQVE